MRLTHKTPHSEKRGTPIAVCMTTRARSYRLVVRTLSLTHSLTTCSQSNRPKVKHIGIVIVTHGVRLRVGEI